jgi:acetyl/propionyl-CoA carboxylase alpha subunit/acetyl-CoA carboxylase carboxyltransferase component
LKKLLIANRGEIAVRIARTAADLGIGTVTVHSEDDALSLHTRVADETRGLPGAGPAPYLRADLLIGAAADAGCDALHPGYGFLSEDAGLARACAEAGVVFVGPTPDTLDAMGNKAAARALAQQVGVPVLAGSDGRSTVEQARDLLASLGEGGAVMVKAIAGGGGRGMRPVTAVDELESAFERCASEALAAFGNAELYVEQLLRHARHVEVQVVGDGLAVAHLWDRECSLQRNRQKVIEIAPATALPDATREALLADAVRVASLVGYRGLGTIEFLVAPDGNHYFIEANPRLQVEHTITEEVTGQDLVAVQLAIADGATLSDLGLTQDRIPEPRGVALQARINLETMLPDGTIRPTGGRLAVFDPPSGPGIRIDTFGYAGYETSNRFDSLLAKVIVHTPTGGVPGAVRKAQRALAEFAIDGVDTNITLLQGILTHPAVSNGRIDTQFIADHVAELLAGGGDQRRTPVGQAPSATPSAVGSRVDPNDPLAILTLGRTADATASDPAEVEAPLGAVAVRAPMLGMVVAVSVQVGDTIRADQTLVVVEAMKLEHLVSAGFSGVVKGITAEVGATVPEGTPLVFVERVDTPETTEAAVDAGDLDTIRPDLAAVEERRARILDDGRPAAVARRHGYGLRTARENLEDLCDPGSFTEYGPLTIAARQSQYTVDELLEQTPADGFVCGLGKVNGDLFPKDKARCLVMSYDATVLAGTQGHNGHVKLDRMAQHALRWRVPMIFFAEGGGGRPGDIDAPPVVRTFEYLAQVSAAAPLIGITSGRCFAGNVAMLGCCDVIIATKDAILGMGGPVAVEGGSLGVYRPEEIGPAPIMEASGVIDILVDDEAAAVAAAKKYLSYFQGTLAEWTCADQQELRHLLPENRMRSYDVRRIIEVLADIGSVLELRPKFGRAMITALVRIEGRPLGVIANDPRHVGGAVDSDAADKAARFLQVCDAFDIPVVSLSDTPGNMVGPDAEKTGLIRHCSRLFLVGANLTVALFAVIIRKSYGLGSYSMIGGSPHAPFFHVSWPSGEFAGMGVEGGVKLQYRKELESIADPVERKAFYDELVAATYEQTKALVRSTGPYLDDVIDPADTRAWIAAGLDMLPPVAPRTEKKYRYIDAW